MAEVWKAKSFGVEGFEKTLVLKRMLPELAKVPELSEMFVHEALLSVRLSHANIVHVFDLGRVEESGEERPSYYIAMEYVAGLDLATVIARARRQKTQLPFGMAVFVGTEVAKALDHAHRRRDEQGRPLGIVHRDVSPQNILVSWEGEVKVTDFGIAKAMGTRDLGEASEGSAPRIVGKLSYMSPEQSMGASVDGRSDLFALGTVLYELVAGTNPFFAKSKAETLRRVRAAEVPPLELVRPDVPHELSVIVRKLLAKEPEARFADAGKVHEALLGYFYATGDRFGASDLAQLIEPYLEPEPASLVSPGNVLGEADSRSDERTPVEVPHAQRSALRERTERTDIASPAAQTDPIGERREATLLLVCPSGRSGRMPLDVRAAGDVIKRHGGLVAEEGSARVVALFGLDEADGRDTEAAIRAALVVLREQKGRGLSAGVEVGRVLVDARGMPIWQARMAELVSMAEVLAARVEGQVALSHRAARIARAAFTFEDLSPDRGALPEGGRVVVSARPPVEALGKFVGRKEELRRMGEVIASAAKKHAEVVTVLGQKGIGKTRFLMEVERRLSRGNFSVGFYVARCPLAGAESPWSALRAMLEVLCGVQEGDTEEAILATLPRLRALGLQEDEARAVLQTLGARLAESVKKPNAGSVATALRTAFSRMVHKLSEDRLHIFVWDDVQAMDSATAELVASVACRADGSRAAIRAVFLLASRTSPPSALLPLPQHQVLTLGTLGEEESERLLAERLSVPQAPPELVGFVLERASGHPLFIEELLRELVDARAVFVEDGQVRLRLEGARAIPRALRALMEARMIRLAADERVLLQAAAILGDPVNLEVLAAIVGRTFSAVDRLIADLSTRGFLRAKGPTEVSFTSPLAAEIVLDSIPQDMRRDLSARAAQGYLAVFGEEGADVAAERIGHHFQRAGERDRAATYLARAGLSRLSENLPEPALPLLYRALDLADLSRREPTELALWLRELCRAVVIVRSCPELPDLAERVLRRLDAAGALADRVTTRVELARALGACNLFELASASIDLADKIAASEETLTRVVLIAEIEMCTRSGDYARAARAADKIEELGLVDDPRTLFCIANARAATGVAAAALLAIARAEELSPKGDPVLDLEREKRRALVYAFMRDFRAATEALAHAVELSRMLGLRAELAVALHNIGDTARRLGDLPRAYAALTESVEVAEEAGLGWLVSQDRIHLAYLDGMGGKVDAEVRLRELIRQAQERGFLTDALEGRALLAALLLHRGESEEGKREFVEVLRLAESVGNGLLADDARVALARLG